MLRAFFLYLSTAAWARRLVMHWGPARGFAMRFVAGETVESALAIAKKLNGQGLRVSLDYLGESVHQAEETRQVVATYRQLLTGIHTGALQAGVSLKLTHLGLDISPELCLANLRDLLKLAAEYKLPVTIDMENTPYTDRTLQLYRALCLDEGFSILGTVIQAYLYRSEADMRALAAEGARIRLCKGAYLESPDLAYPQKTEVDANYLRLSRLFLEAPPPAYLELATHDEHMINGALAIIREQGLGQDRYEFQMLYGIRGGRQLELVAQGEPVRVYLPFGEAWYPYFMRRLAERPANVWFLLRSLFRK
jgi:proline dehydrogenase